MGKRRPKNKREGYNEQSREAEETHVQETTQNIQEDHDAINTNANNTSNNSNEVKVNDRPSNESDNQSRDRPERPQEDIKVNDKTEQEVKESLQKDIIYLRDAIYPHWQAFLNALGDPRNWFLTKEDFEIVKAYFSQAEANINANIMEYLRTASNDPCKIHTAIQFLVIRKLGTIQIQAHKNRIDAILQAIQYQSQMYQTVAQSLAQVVQSFTNSYTLQAGLSSFEIPNIVQDIKASTVIGTLIGALTAIGIEIGNLKNNLRSLIRFNEFCIRPCRAGCPDTIPLASSIGMLKIASNHNASEYNEGVELANESEVFLRALEKLINLELEYMEKQIREGKLDINNRKRKNTNNG
jgi:hypothetical protein